MGFISASRNGEQITHNKNEKRLIKAADSDQQLSYNTLKLLISTSATKKM